MELELEELEAAAAEDAIGAAADGAVVQAFTRRKPVRAPLPEHLPRERVVIPGPTICPCCGGKLTKLGETVTESLESVPRQCWCGRPPRHRACQNEVVADLRQRGQS